MWANCPTRENLHAPAPGPNHYAQQQARRSVPPPPAWAGYRRPVASRPSGPTRRHSPAAPGPRSVPRLRVAPVAAPPHRAVPYAALLSNHPVQQQIPAQGPRLQPVSPGAGQGRADDREFYREVDGEGADGYVGHGVVGGGEEEFPRVELCGVEQAGDQLEDDRTDQQRNGSAFEHAEGVADEWAAEQSREDRPEFDQQQRDGDHARDHMRALGDAVEPHRMCGPVEPGGRVLDPVADQPGEETQCDGDAQGDAYPRRHRRTPSGRHLRRDQGRHEQSRRLRPGSSGAMPPRVFDTVVSNTRNLLSHNELMPVETAQVRKCRCAHGATSGRPFAPPHLSEAGEHARHRGERVTAGRESRPR